MESVDNIVHKIETNQYPVDDPNDLWGVGFNVTEDMNTNIFHNISAEIVRLINSKKDWDNDDDVSLPQIIIGYQQNNWLIKYEDYGDGSLPLINTVTIVTSRANILILLNMLRGLNIRIYDVYNNDI